MKILFFVFLCLLLTACSSTNIEFDEQVHPDNHGQAPTEMPQFDQELLQPVLFSSVEYFPGTQGYLAYPSMPGDYPGVIMIHEWWGLNEHIEQEARRLASQGYRVLAVDLFEGSVALTSANARENVEDFDEVAAMDNLRAANDYLRGLGSQKVASLGWCFGGGQSMQLAVSQVDLDASVVYYGRVITDEEALSSIDQPLLGIFGSLDSSIHLDDVRKMEYLLDLLNKPNKIIVYEGVGHAFANPANEGGFAMVEAEQAWDETLAFLDSELKG